MAAIRARRLDRLACVVGHVHVGHAASLQALGRNLDGLGEVGPVNDSAKRRGAPCRVGFSFFLYNLPVPMTVAVDTFRGAMGACGALLGAGREAGPLGKACMLCLAAIAAMGAVRCKPKAAATSPFLCTSATVFPPPLGPRKAPWLLVTVGSVKVPLAPRSRSIIGSKVLECDAASVTTAPGRADTEREQGHSVSVSVSVSASISPSVSVSVSISGLHHGALAGKMEQGSHHARRPRRHRCSGGWAPSAWQWNRRRPRPHQHVPRVPRPLEDTGLTRL